jgi:dihydroflavonol-4-reductase
MDRARSQPPGTALVTGASGFVGVNLVLRLRELGWAVRTFDRVRFATPGVGGVASMAGDVRDRGRLDEALVGVDVVFHLAAIITLRHGDPEAWGVNTTGPATVARAALDHDVARLVHVSSVHAFDLARARPRLREDSPRAGADRPLYDRSKAVGEAAVREVVADGLDAVIVNPTAVIGPIDLGPSRANGILLAAARGHLPVAVAGGFDWVDVRDVVDGCLAALDRGRTGEGYLLSGHQATSVQIGRLAAGLNGRLGPLFGLPAGLAASIAPLGERVGRLWGSDDFTPASIGTLLDDPLVDRAKAGGELGYRPRALEDTVRDLVRWYRARGALGPRPGFGRRRRARSARRR